MSSLFDVAIVGAGAGGTTLAANLVRRWPSARIALIDGRGFGRGLAYSTPYALHLLNVPAGKMSALASDPDHFLHWLQTRTVAGAGSFAMRRQYGDYLEELLAEARRSSQGALVLIRSAATSATRGDGWTIALENGEALRARSVVLALGNDAPAPLRIPGAELARESGKLFASPWDSGALDISDGEVLLVGTGLTAIDAAIALAEAGLPVVHALSRHGLLPTTHALAAPFAVRPFDRPHARGWLRHLRLELQRAEREGSNWRSVIDGLRSITAPTWRALGIIERRRFLRHLRHHWDTHRHRMAPEIGARVDRLRAEGRLRVHAARLVEMTIEGERAQVRIRPRAQHAAVRLSVARVINCTGPGSLSESRNPLVRQLLIGRHIELDPLGLGLHVDPSGRALSSGAPVDGMFALGPLRRGECWESTAMPEIRVQSAELAELLARELTTGSRVTR